MSSFAKSCTVLALAGGAVAFSPTMSISANRRQVVQSGAAAAVAAPLLRTAPATAASYDNFPGRAPVISVLDHRGCSRKGTEYTGQRSGGTDDEMCVIVRNPEIKVSDESARKYLQEVISYQAKGIDGVFDGQSPFPGKTPFSCPTEGCK
eukprot:CAMPEP_0173102152 /NCGR_PEP_ID=MMETSP1102-20130122/37363_1 /TAXON_ID=49646 /ORGANISM="Geminigera sp., Strain Caron Lab Isolate" /LENGTH=149 /DNA_ID=CAMNT_0013996199 /DNA_START=305 /DNA_END=754 /DNA_ORIENTATION=+